MGRFWNGNSIMGWYTQCAAPNTYSKVKLSLCLTKHHAMKTYWGSGGIAPRILDFGTRWRWVVSFTPLPLYPQGKPPVPTGQEAGWAPEPFWTR
jgi:hypothetical protein